MNAAVDYNDANGCVAGLASYRLEQRINDALKAAGRKKKRAELKLLKASEACKSLREQIAMVDVTNGAGGDFVIAARLCDELCKRQSELKIRLMEYELDIEEIDDKYGAELRAIEEKYTL